MTPPTAASMVTPVEDVQLRRGTSSDLDRCRKIEVAGDRLFVRAGHPEFADADPVSAEEFHRAVERGTVVVAELVGTVVGFCLSNRCGDEWCIGQISVDPQLQRRGIGRALLEEVISDARSAGEPSIVLNTQSDVAWNRPWYEGFGFEVVHPTEWTPAMRELVAQQNEAGFDWDTRVHMRLTLARGNESSR